jgi:hypothetical protein
MKKEDWSYLQMILLHAFLGVLVYFVPFLSKIYVVGIIIYGTYYIVSSNNKQEQAIYAAAYLMGSEVFLRMTGGNFLYEITKYGIIYFVLLAAFFNGFSKHSFVYWLYIVLLIPSIVIAATDINVSDHLKNNISFNLSGPICLGFSAVYMYRRKVSLAQINAILLAIGLPIVSTTIYLILYTPSVRDVVTGTGSNFATSGGFGPNQVATIMGLGLFVFCSRIILDSKSKIILLVNLLIALTIAYRGIVTFSRGGMITGVAMVLLLLIFLYYKVNGSGKQKMRVILFFGIFAVLGTWFYSSYQTGGLIDNRYANKDALGREKSSLLTGRGDIAQTEWNMFLDHPIVGVGVGGAKEERIEATGDVVASHSEVSRLLAEHGMLGVLSLLILGITPLVLFFENKFNLYLLSFYVFWALTINHAAMRIAAPAFIYSLCLLDVQLFSSQIDKNEI